jgi:hypothetical protein
MRRRERRDRGEEKRVEMPNYTFQLRDGRDPIEDDVGVTLTDRQDAYHYARGVVRELASGRETQREPGVSTSMKTARNACLPFRLRASTTRSTITSPNCGSRWRDFATVTAVFVGLSEEPSGNCALARPARAIGPT